MTTIDINNAFSSIAIDEKDQKNLAFTWNNRKYTFLRASQGLKNVPAIFHSIMCDMFSRQSLDKYKEKFPNTIAFVDWMEFMIHYVDDICVYTSNKGTKEEVKNTHKNAVHAILSTIGENNLRGKGDKIELFKSRITFLGYKIDSQDNWKTIPEAKQEVFRFQMGKITTIVL